MTSSCHLLQVARSLRQALEAWLPRTDLMVPTVCLSIEISELRTNRILELQYRLSYVEESIRPNSKSWVIRQMGVYHHYYPETDSNLWIFIHPRPNSPAQRRLEDAIRRWEQLKSGHQSWHLTHLLLISTYFNDWRWYLKSLSAEIEQIVSRCQS